MTEFRPDYAIQYAFGRLFMLLTQSVPLPAAVKLGEWAGRRMVRWTRRNYAIGLDNLFHAFPGMSREAAESLLLDMYAHFGRATVEMAFAQRMLGPTTYRRRLEIVNENVLHDARRAGRGAIFVTAHMGPWEVLSVLLRNLGFETTTVYRPLGNPYFDGFIRRTRKRFGQTMVPRVGALPRLLRVLRRGGYIALLADQHAKREGVWTPFFGRPASTTPAPAVLALRTGAPIVTGYVHRLPGLYRFEVVLGEPIRPENTGDRDADVYRITAEISRRIESYVRRRPEQWLWVHRRWHRIPAYVNEKGKADVRPSGQPA
jgi:KDO2-lipid IV(A) lauroyltransferase